MSLTKIVKFVIGLVLAGFGLMLIVSTVAGLPATWLQVLIGLGLIAVGLYIMSDGSFTI